jgi:hypothetical protein
VALDLATAIDFEKDMKLYSVKGMEDLDYDAAAVLEAAVALAAKLAVPQLASKAMG